MGRAIDAEKADALVGEIAASALRTRRLTRYSPQGLRVDQNKRHMAGLIAAV